MKLPTLILSLVALATYIHAAPSDQNHTSNVIPKAVDYRLTEAVLPSYYKMQFTPYLLASDGGKRFTFDGFVDITLSPRQNGLKAITLHARDLTFRDVSLKGKSTGASVAIVNVTGSDPETNQFSVNVQTELNTSLEYVLSFNYTGIMGDDMKGFYKSKYTNAKGEEIYIGSTHFPTIHARRAFPCFDEPKFKAQFKIEITYPSRYDAVSNTLREIRTDTGGIAKTVFKETPNMSTYLVAFIISDFAGRGNDSFRVFARPEAYNQTQYAHEVGPKLMANLNNFTGYPYSNMGLEKMDLAGIPDFSSGAMENWGLLTYRETSLLYDPSVSTLYNQQRVATVIAHELAHQWFGDLVTCDWWGYTWLNEGFGRYFHYFTANEVEPTWELDKQFVVEQLQVVMNMDSLAGTTPMSDPTVASPTELSRMFNSISYNKAASIVRMTKHMMGESRFKAGLQQYIRNRQFKTAVPQDLFNAFASQWTGSDNISSILQDWTEQVGYPVVTITLGNNGTYFTVKQSRFLLRENAGDASLLYQIPLTYTTSAEMDFNNTNTRFILSKTKDETTVRLDKVATWIIANVQEVGYYRVNYDDTTWSNIRKALGSSKHGNIHELNRAQIVDDVLNLGRAGILKYEKVIDILNYLKTETNYLPWYAAFQGYTTLSIRVGVNNQKSFKAYILQLLDRAYKSVGYTRKETEDRLVTYNRASVLSWACKYDHSDCVRQAKKLFVQFMNRSEPVEVNIRSVVYCTAIANGGEAEFNFLWNKFRIENVATQQVLILGALGCSKDKTILNRYLDLVLSDAVRLQDRQAAFQGTYTSFIENVDIVWEYVQIKYKSMITSFNSQSTVASIISGLASRFTTQVQRTSLNTFINNNKADFGSSQSTLTSALNTVDYNLKWSAEALKPFVDHIKAVGDGAATISISTILVMATSYLVAFMLN